jgi:hypothetical protein
VSDDIAIYDSIAMAVALGREPDLSAYDPDEVRTALERVLRFPAPRHTFLAWFDGRVRQLSGGSVTVEERPADPNAPAAALPVRRIVAGEPFAEPLVITTGAQVLAYPMRRPVSNFAEDM